MRSSVCALNAATGENFNMNFPDYDQTTAHHSCLLVLIRGIGVNLHKSKPDELPIFIAQFF